MLIAISYRLDTGAIATALRGLALAAIVVCVFVFVATVAPLALAAVATGLTVVAHVAGIIAAMIAHAVALALALVVRLVILYAAVKLASAASHVNWRAVGAVVKPLAIAVAGVAYNLGVIAGAFGVVLASVKLM